MRDKKTMNRAVFPGSFDPVTVGHMDLIVRSAKMFDEVIVGVLRNAAKQPLCTVAERVSLLQELTAEIPGVRIEAFDGLLIDFVDKMDACAVIRGLRTAADFEYELPLAQTNRHLNAQVDTVFLATSPEHSYISSSVLKKLFSLVETSPDWCRLLYSSFCWIGTQITDNINRQYAARRYIW